MLIQILLAILIGLLAGTLTGLIPGIHINLIGTLLIASIATIPFVSNISPIYLMVFITSMAITHTFLDFIPSIFLGAPDTDTELSVLPGHELLKKGQGYFAISLTTLGSLAAIFILVLIAGPSIFLISRAYGFAEKFLPYILIIVSLFVISLDKHKFKALEVFLVTGILGLITLNLFEFNQPLLPLLSGLFGGSMIVLSIRTKTKIPKQEIKRLKFISILKNPRPLLGALIAAPLCSLLPGLGSGQAAVIGHTISTRKNYSNQRDFLVLLGATNTLVMGFSFISLYVINKTRTGAALAIKEIFGQPILNSLILILITILITGPIAFFLTFFLAEFFSKNITKISYTLISSIVLTILVLVIFFVSGFAGILIFVVSTATGIFAIHQGVRRTNMMGCLLIPTILLYLL